MQDKETPDSEFREQLERISRNRPAYADRKTAAVLRSFTPARIGLGRSGTRPLTREVLQFRMDHAAARDTIADLVSEDLIAATDCLPVTTRVADKEEYLLRPDLGRRLRREDEARLKAVFRQGERVLLLIGDGLSAAAIEANLEEILPSLRLSLERFGCAPPRPIFVRYARVGAMDHIGEILRPETVIYLIGERPGLITAQSMSAYLCYRPRIGTVEADRNVISNIHRGGLPPLEAGAVIADLIYSFLRHRASGVSLAGIFQ